MRTQIQIDTLKELLEFQIQIEVAVLKKLHQMSQRHNTVACEDLIEVSEFRIEEIKRQLEEL